LDLLWWQTI